MFPRAKRLSRSQDILVVLRRGEKIRRGPITMCYLDRTGDQRITVVVDKKVAKQAVIRNLVKRRLRELLKRHQLPEGWMVVRAYSGVEKLDFSELRNLVDQCFLHPRLRSGRIGSSTQSKG